METVLISLLTLVTGAVVSGVLTYVGTKRKLELDYDADLRKKRMLGGTGRPSLTAIETDRRSAVNVLQ